MQKPPEIWPSESRKFSMQRLVVTSLSHGHGVRPTSYERALQITVTVNFFSRESALVVTFQFPYFVGVYMRLVVIKDMDREGQVELLLYSSDGNTRLLDDKNDRSVPM